MKKKNPATCRLQIGDRVANVYNPTRKGVLINRAGSYASFIVKWDGATGTNQYCRYELDWIDSPPTEPEPYEAWFVA